MDEPMPEDQDPEQLELVIKRTFLCFEPREKSTSPLNSPKGRRKSDTEVFCVAPFVERLPPTLQAPPLSRPPLLPPDMAAQANAYPWKLTYNGGIEEQYSGTGSPIFPAGRSESCTTEEIPASLDGTESALTHSPCSRRSSSSTITGGPVASPVCGKPWTASTPPPAMPQARPAYVYQHHNDPPPPPLPEAYTKGHQMWAPRAQALRYDPLEAQTAAPGPKVVCAPPPERPVYNPRGPAPGYFGPTTPAPFAAAGGKGTPAGATVRRPGGKGRGGPWAGDAPALGRPSKGHAQGPSDFMVAACTAPAEVAAHGGRTTVMLKNLPPGLPRDMFTYALDQAGFSGAYDFVYVPISFRTEASMCYAFVNMVTPMHAQRCFTVLAGFADWGMASDKVCEVTWSDKLQGLFRHIERYRNSPLMHEKVPDKFKPAVYEGGVRVAFPPPTRALRPPRIRRRDDDEGDHEGVL